MDALCVKAGIHGMAAPPIAAGCNVDLRLSAAAEKPSVSATPPRNLAWGFTFRHPLRSLWPGSKIRLEPAIAVDDAVLAEEKEAELGKGNWVSKVVHLRKFGKGEENEGENLGEERESCGDEKGNSCEECVVEKMEFDRDSFSKLLRKVPLAESRLYAQLSYLGSLAYSIPQIKPRNLLRYHGLQFVTSSLEKKSKNEDTREEEEEEASGAYQIAASYFHSRTKSILRLGSSKDDVASMIAAEEDVKQAVADDLNSSLSSPCEWFICDDHQSATRFFVIQGSESLSSWKANLLFEPVQFEGLDDVVVHRGIYEAAKGIYEQMLPEIEAHLKQHGDGARFRFTGHSLGGSLSVLVNLMVLIRKGAPRWSLLPVITYGAPSIMCGGDALLRELGLPRNHVRSLTMHRDIVPRAFSCNYPTHVAHFLKAVNANFRNHPCLLSKQKMLYAPMGELLILQPDEEFSPNHQLLPGGSGLYVLRCAEAQAAFLNSPHPLEILSERSAYGSQGTVQRDHDMKSYLKSIRNVIRQDLRKPIVSPGRRHFNFSWRTLVASQHMHLLLVLFTNN